MSDSEQPQRALQRMGGSTTDPARAILMGALSGIPIIGGIVSEIIGQIIPEQRIERLEDYVRALGERLGQIEEGELRRRMKEPENVDLFEDGAVASARALSEDQRERIASVVATGISGDEKARVEAKRLLGLLSQLGDDQIIRLSSYLMRHQRDQSFHETHTDVLYSHPATRGSSPEERDQAVIHDLARAELIRLNLLRERFKKPAKGEMPEFDEKTGKIKAQSRELTPLGRLLLRRTGIAGEDEF